MNDGARTDGGSERIVFQMEVEPETEPISGLIRRGEREHAFVGWVALASALERILEPNGSANPTNGRDLPR